jgi:hypothetical protein
VCEEWVEAWVEDRTRGEYRFNSLIKKQKKRRNCDVSVCSKHKRGTSGHSCLVRLPCYDLELVYGLWCAVGVLGVFIRRRHRVEMGWFDTFYAFSHLLGECKTGVT